MTKLLACLAAPMVLALTACEDDPAAVDGNENREASGEVLEGSISDAMIPLDELQSQAPLAAPEPGEGGGGASAAPAAGADETATEEPPAEEAQEAPVEAEAEPAE